MFWILVQIFLVVIKQKVEFKFEARHLKTSSKVGGVWPKICDIFRAAKTEATGCSDVISCARRHGRKKKILLVAPTQSWLRVYHRLSKTSVLCSMYFALECLLRLDLAGHDSKGDICKKRSHRRYHISANANNSMTKSQILNPLVCGCVCDSTVNAIVFLGRTQAGNLIFC